MNYNSSVKWLKSLILILLHFSEGWRNKIKEYHTFLEEDWQYGTDESMRFGKPKTSEAMFGLEGSFRQLDVD